MSCASTSLIQAEALSLNQGGRVILSQVSLNVNRGEIVTLIGPNGAGKSTLIKALLGLIPVTSGSISRAAGLSIGYMPQRLPIDPVMPLTVSRLLTLTHRTDESEQLDVLAEVGVPHLLKEQVHTLSGGELQRVLLARALLRKPDLLVLDEPTQGVDFVGESELYRLITHIRDQRGCGVLMVSHDLHLVMAATDQVICLNHHVCCAGAPDSVQKHPEYLALFGPHLADNLAIYTHHHDHQHDVSGAVVPADQKDETP